MNASSSGPRSEMNSTGEEEEKVSTTNGQQASVRKCTNCEFHGTGKEVESHQRIEHQQEVTVSGEKDQNLYGTFIYVNIYKCFQIMYTQVMR
jgi:hypothetical protein